ncbi:uncharacterized protein LOC132940567 [Metopolophium dirhodum]|uniref:uncharacterized protein LOC132940567 n=1 Tax=Metopolophium dirhodum TaxID=44670 RepID=UPI00298FD49D|nr:uncharacterized protein LOC132940567 [Metopolophium dirhodum]
MNFTKLLTIVSNRDTGISFLQQHNIIKVSEVCENGHIMSIKGSRWRCQKRSCRKEKGLRINNWLTGSRLPIHTIVHFIYYWAREMSSVTFCKRELNMGQNAVVDWSNYLREVCVWKLENNQNKEIGGPGLFVEIDESLFVRRKNNAGRILPQQWIFGGICRDTKACFIISVPDRSEKTLLPIIQKYIRPGSIILSDCWKAYNNLQQVGFKHNTVNHTYNFVDPDTGAHTQHIERLWGSAKWGNKKRRGTNRNFLESYLAEFMWRTRLGEQDAFETILKDISEFWPPL